ncbi:bacillithiol system redox-active protein YtxJ [Flavobacterium salilacus subsp. salilacus]|uniref:bacillithiol system redox-active protein YtxJ n=1 Tax=Flavobacterium TaxID=237 RepID=UPI001074E5D7|nr:MULTISPECIES: bacillithiol system redox-active protein YtxJ [Flavobacterium]KAF2517491.1 bacillithiol system redox-active protein YtxJ [Flavobacterium salilacus subsp. salilacus]MBE1615638.1 bacillithiol system redox-active protein YtxJ [Flavobacterium sp. SaA2.13]
MSFFDKMFGNNDSKVTSSSRVKWNDLTELQQLDGIVKESATMPVLIFKHSTRCSISRMALKSFEREYSIEENDVKAYFLDLLAHRDISNEIAVRFGVIHQSPQILLIKNGEVVFHASHNDIDAALVKEKV